MLDLPELLSHRRLLRGRALPPTSGTLLSLPFPFPVERSSSLTNSSLASSSDAFVDDNKHEK